MQTFAEEQTTIKSCDPWNTLGIGVDLSCYVFKKEKDILYWAPKSSKRIETIRKIKYYGVPIEESDYVNTGVIEYEWDENITVYDWSCAIPGPLMRELLK